jgi:hypothetical protein
MQVNGMQAFTGDGITTRFGVTIPDQPDINFTLVATVLYANDGNAGTPEIMSSQVGIRKGDHGGNSFLVHIEPAPLADHMFEVDWILIRADVTP